MTNPLRELGTVGQAVWLDYLHPQILSDGSLRRLIDEDGVTGLTSNPSIFEKAFTDADVYDRRVQALSVRDDITPEALYEKLAIEDIQAAADIFRPTYDRLGGKDGYVSLEVSPRLAMCAESTIIEARRLWRSVGRPNLMIKVPGTTAAGSAIRHLVAEGINVNVTLLFGIDAYLAVAEAHMEGLECLKAQGEGISQVHGVASFFVSRIDSKIDKAIDDRLRRARGEEAEALRRLRGKVAIANAKLAYQHYLRLVATPRWQALARAGASPQRLLWASTSTKDPAFPDTLYADALIGPDTVDTLPQKTLEAFRDHGRVTQSLTEDVAGAEQVLAEAERLRLDLEAVTESLVIDGVKQFDDAFTALLKAVAEKQDQMAEVH